jgi:hypothetical protein
MIYGWLLAIPRCATAIFLLNASRKPVVEKGWDLEKLSDRYSPESERQSEYFKQTVIFDTYNSWTSHGLATSGELKTLSHPDRNSGLRECSEVL